MSNLKDLCLQAQRVRSAARAMQQAQFAFDKMLVSIYGDGAELPDELVESIYYAHGEAPSPGDFTKCMGAPNTA